MSSLEVLQTCPQQRKAFLPTIGGFDLSDSSLIAFNVNKATPCLFHYIDFQIIMCISHKNIHHTLVDEGSSTCFMSASCWKAIGSPMPATSSATLQDFDGHNFVPKGVLLNFSIELGRKIVHVDVEVVDSTLDYNLLLGHSWFYAMTVVISSIFRLLFFPYEGKIITIDQLDFYVPSA